MDVASGVITDSSGNVVGNIDPVTGDITDPTTGEVIGKTDGNGNITEVYEVETQGSTNTGAENDQFWNFNADAQAACASGGLDAL